MIINDKEYGGFDVYLCDGGTLDTVVSVSPHNHDLWQRYGEHEIRFSDCSHYRDSESGAMTDNGFKELAEEAVTAYIEQYLI